MCVVPVVQPRFDFDCVKGMDCRSMIHIAISYRLTGNVHSKYIDAGASRMLPE